MKKSVILSAILFGSLVYNNANAQISVHIGFNVPARRVYVPAPPPQPVEVYDNDEFDDSDDYYYLPEVEAYYSIPRHCYYYQDGGRWISAAYLPGAYRNYDWRTSRRFEVRGRRPYMHHDEYRNKWGGGFNRDWNRRDNNYAGRGFDNNRNQWNRGNNRYDRPQGGFNQPNRDRGNEGGWNRGGNDHNQGAWGGGQPSQPNRNDDNRGGRDRGQGGWGQPNRNDNNNHGGWDRGNQPSQPSRNDNGGGRDRANQGGGNAQFAQNGQGRGDFHRQARF
jgi:hypothetical protein